MAGKTISMHQIKQIAELLSKDYSVRSIVRLTGIARNTVRDYRYRITQTKTPIDELLKLDDSALTALLERKPVEQLEESDRKADLESRLDYFSSELRRRGVTRQLLWDEYRQENPFGYSYSQFCDHLSKALQVKNAVMHFTHHPGERMMVDFAGDPPAVPYFPNSTIKYTKSCEASTDIRPLFLFCVIFLLDFAVGRQEYHTAWLLKPKYKNNGRMSVQHYCFFSK